MWQNNFIFPWIHNFFFRMLFNPTLQTFIPHPGHPYTFITLLSFQYCSSNCLYPYPFWAEHTPSHTYAHTQLPEVYYLDRSCECHWRLVDCLKLLRRSHPTQDWKETTKWWRVEKYLAWICNINFPVIVIATSNKIFFNVYWEIVK